MIKIITISLLLIFNTAYSGCTYTNPSPFPNPLVLANGDTLCITAASTVSTQLTVKNGAHVFIDNVVFRVNGSMTVQANAKVYLNGCNSQLQIWGSYSGTPNKCEMHYFCSTCDLSTSAPYLLIGGAHAWYEWCCITPTPVELIYFKVKEDDCVNELIWATGSETNSDIFIIQRSVDAKYWENLKVMKAAGFSNNLIEYSYIDKVDTSFYYRIKQIDYDDSSEIFNIEYSKCIKTRILLKKVNFLGQKVNSSYRGVIFYIYSDGTKEVKFTN